MTCYRRWLDPGGALVCPLPKLRRYSRDRRWPLGLRARRSAAAQTAWATMPTGLRVMVSVIAAPITSSTPAVRKALVKLPVAATM